MIYATITNTYLGFIDLRSIDLTNDTHTYLGDITSFEREYIEYMYSTNH